MRVREALTVAARRLAQGSDTPRLDAELLMATALATDRDALLLSSRDQAVPARFEELVERRAAGEPVAYIIGRRAFWTIELDVAPGVLIPRPDTETLIEAAVAHFGERAPRTILDLGTGSGALLLAALDQWPSAHGVGIDISDQAVAIASANATRLGMARRTTFQRGDWAAGLRRRFDLVLCNPPYVEAGATLPRDVSEWEPAGALFAGENGLAAYRQLAPPMASLLEVAGIACVEIGAGQEQAVTALFGGTGLAVASRRDLRGHVRCLILTA